MNMKFKTPEQRLAKVRRLLAWWGRTEAKRHKRSVEFLSQYTTVYCGLSNEPLNIETMQMHHHGIGLKELIDGFLEYYETPIEDFVLFKEYHETFEAMMWKLEDEVVDAWRGYHNRNAHIMAVNKKPHKRFHYQPKKKPTH